MRFFNDSNLNLQDEIKDSININIEQLIEEYEENKKNLKEYDSYINHVREYKGYLFKEIEDIKNFITSQCG